MENGKLKSLLEKLSGKVRYADFKSVQQSEVSIALRSDSFEMREESDDRVSCRVLDQGYGLATTDHPDEGRIEAIAESALKQAKSIHASINLVPVKPEEGEYSHPLKKPLDIDEARGLLLSLRELLRSKLGDLRSSSEFVLSHLSLESSLVTSEGTDVSERAHFTDLILYLIVRDMGVGYASKVVGGKGGFEAVEKRDWDGIISELVARARDSSKAQLLSPLMRGRRFNVILDAEASGAVAHEVAHALEADSFQMKFFQGLEVHDDLKLVDNPQVPGAYGSFVWDDEGVRGKEKVLLKRGSLELLHTRATAGERGTPGNAHGITHIPKPTMSNVYFQPSDWEVKEMFEETGSGIYAKGVLRAETDLSDGRLELAPETAYLIEKSEIKTPIKHLKVVDNIRSVIQRIDAIGKTVHLRPNLEKGFAIAEGGPHIRISGVHCT